MQVVYLILLNSWYSQLSFQSISHWDSQVCSEFTKSLGSFSYFNLSEEIWELKYYLSLKIRRIIQEQKRNKELWTEWGPAPKNRWVQSTEYFGPFNIMILFSEILFRKLHKDNLDVEGFWCYIRSFSVDVMKPLKTLVQSKT